MCYTVGTCKAGCITFYFCAFSVLVSVPASISVDSAIPRSASVVDFSMRASSSALSVAPVLPDYALLLLLSTSAISSSCRTPVISPSLSTPVLSLSLP